MTEYGELNETDLKSVEIYISFVKMYGSSADAFCLSASALSFSRKNEMIFAAVSRNILLIDADACRN